MFKSNLFDKLLSMCISLLFLNPIISEKWVYLVAIPLVKALPSDHNAWPSMALLLHSVTVKTFRAHCLLSVYVSPHVFYPFTQKRKCLFLIKVSTWRKMRLTASINHALTLKAFYCQYIILIRCMCLCCTLGSFWFVFFMVRKCFDIEGVLLIIALIVYNHTVKVTNYYSNYYYYVCLHF